jgi:hypothetical protein
MIKFILVYFIAKYVIVEALLFLKFCLNDRKQDNGYFHHKWIFTYYCELIASDQKNMSQKQAGFVQRQLNDETITISKKSNRALLYFMEWFVWNV